MKSFTYRISRSKLKLTPFVTLPSSFDVFRMFRFLTNTKARILLHFHPSLSLSLHLLKSCINSFAKFHKNTGCKKITYQKLAVMAPQTLLPCFSFVKTTRLKKQFKPCCLGIKPSKVQKINLPICPLPLSNLVVTVPHSYFSKSS